MVPGVVSSGQVPTARGGFLEKPASGENWWRPGFGAKGGVGSVAPARAEGPETRWALPFWALMAFTLILFLAPQGRFASLASLRIAMLSGVIAIAAHLLERFARRESLSRITLEVSLAACLAVWGLLTVPLSSWPGGSLSFLLGVYFKTLAVFWLLCNVLGTPARILQTAWSLTLLSVPLGVTAVGDYLNGSFLEAGAAPGVERIAGYDAPLTANPNDLALVLNLVLPLSVAIFRLARRPFLRALLFGVILLDVVAIILTFSRAGFLTLLATLAITFWRLLRGPERGWAVAALLLALLSLPLVPSHYWTRLGTIAHIELDPTGSGQARWSDMIFAARYVFEHPIVGAGAGMNALALNELRGPAWKVVHNVYLEYAVDLGLPGLALFLLLLVGCLRSVGVVRRGAAGSPTLRNLFHLAEGTQLSLVAFVIAAAFHPVAYHFYFYYIAGLAVATRAAYETETRNPRSQGVEKG